MATKPDPLWEVLASLWVQQQRDHRLVFGEWRRRTRAARPARLRLLLELAPTTGYSPDFLTPGRGEADLVTLMDQVLSTPRVRLREEFTCLARQQRPSAWTRSLADGRLDALNQLRAALAAYHQAGIAPYQDRIRIQVQTDVSRRGQALLAGGVDRLLATLHPAVRWEPPVLRVLDYHADRDLHLHGRGLVLLPSLFLFGEHPIALRATELAPVLVYPVTPALGWLCPTNGARAADPVASLLGPTRAACLRACASTCSTTELARHAHVSSPAASRQATVLRAAGLITTDRRSTAVVHRITGLGIAVLNGHLPFDHQDCAPTQTLAHPGPN